MSADKIVRMANQIATFMLTRPEAEGVRGFADHINDYWDPRMRRQLFTLLDAGGEGLLPMVSAAAPMIRRPEPAGA